MSSTSSPHVADVVHRRSIDSSPKPSDKEELRQTLAQLKLGDECLRRKRLLGGAANQDYMIYSLPVSRVTISSLQYRHFKNSKADE